MKFKELKETAKKNLNANYGFFLMLFLPMWILKWLFVGVNTPKYIDLFKTVSKNHYSYADTNNNFSIISLLISALTLSAMFICINFLRKQIIKRKATDGFKSAFIIFNKNYFWPALAIGFLKGLYTFLWTLPGVVLMIIGIFMAMLKATAVGGLLLLAAIIYMIVISAWKQLSYSQAQYLYRDSTDNSNLSLHTKIGFNGAISASKQLMDGHKGELLLLYISFILWYLLSAITGGLVGFFYSTPYINLTLANYYNHLVKDLINENEVKTE